MCFRMGSNSSCRKKSTRRTAFNRERRYENIQSGRHRSFVDNEIYNDSHRNTVRPITQRHLIAYPSEEYMRQASNVVPESDLNSAVDDIQCCCPRQAYEYAAPSVVPMQPLQQASSLMPERDLTPAEVNMQCCCPRQPYQYAAVPVAKRYSRPPPAPSQPEFTVAPTAKRCCRPQQSQPPQLQPIIPTISAQQQRLQRECCSIGHRSQAPCFSSNRESRRTGACSSNSYPVPPALQQNAINMHPLGQRCEFPAANQTDFMTSQYQHDFRPLNVGVPCCYQATSAPHNEDSRRFKQTARRRNRRPPAQSQTHPVEQRQNSQERSRSNEMRVPLNNGTRDRRRNIIVRTIVNYDYEPSEVQSYPSLPNERPTQDWSPIPQERPVEQYHPTTESDVGIGWQNLPLGSINSNNRRDAVDDCDQECSEFIDCPYRR